MPGKWQQLQPHRQDRINDIVDVEQKEKANSEASSIAANTQAATPIEEKHQESKEVEIDIEEFVEEKDVYEEPSPKVEEEADPLDVQKQKSTRSTRATRSLAQPAQQPHLQKDNPYAKSFSTTGRQRADRMSRATRAGRVDDNLRIEWLVFAPKLCKKRKKRKVHGHVTPVVGGVPPVRLGMLPPAGGADGPRSTRRARR